MDGWSPDIVPAAGSSRVTLNTRHTQDSKIPDFAA
jgi:hypothetical protein